MDMPVTTKVAEFLNRKGVDYQIVSHPRHETALGVAQAGHFPARQMIKAVMVKIDGRDTMFVLPADRMLALFKLRDMFETDDIYVEREKEFDDLFPDCERGAMPPLGSLYGIPCYVDAAIEKEAYIYFNAGSHREAIKLTVKDFLALPAAIEGDFSVARK